MIKTAKERHKQNNLKFELLDINSIHFKNEFDNIVSTYLIVCAGLLKYVK